MLLANFEARSIIKKGLYQRLIQTLLYLGNCFVITLAIYYFSMPLCKIFL